MSALALLRHSVAALCFSLWRVLTELPKWECVLSIHRSWKLELFLSLSPSVPTPHVRAIKSSHQQRGFVGCVFFDDEVAAV